MVDHRANNANPDEYSVELAHKERDGRPAGGNHLFNDGHVSGSNGQAGETWVRMPIGRGPINTIGEKRLRLPEMGQRFLFPCGSSNGSGCKGERLKP